MLIGRELLIPAEFAVGIEVGLFLGACEPVAELDLGSLSPLIMPWVGFDPGSAFSRVPWTGIPSRRRTRSERHGRSLSELCWP